MRRLYKINISRRTWVMHFIPTVITTCLVLPFVMAMALITFTREKKHLNSNATLRLVTNKQT